MLARIAFTNMLRAAWRDPLWAIGSVVFGPLAAIHYVAKVAGVAGFVTVALLFGVHLAMDAIGMACGFRFRPAIIPIIDRPGFR